MAKNKKEPLAPATIGVKEIETDTLMPNPHNPRMLFDRIPLEDLKASIEKVGILVPLTVYWSAQDKRYVILDGQRRWMCAQELDLPRVPVNQVEEPSLVQNIVTMFQIHRLRADWELMPTALKVGVLMKELNERSVKSLATITALNPAIIVRCKKLLSYSKKYQDMMLDLDPAKRVKADFFIELYAVISDRLVTKMGWFSRDEFIQRMLQRYLRGRGIKAVTDFRMMKQHLNEARAANKENIITKRLQEFVEDDSLQLDHLSIKAAGILASAKKILNDVKKVELAIRGVDPEEFYGEEELWKTLERLLVLIRSKLVAAGRRIDE